MTEAQLDPRIGALSSGRFYCFPDGYAAPVFEGSRAEVEQRLQITPASPASSSARPAALPSRAYVVTVRPRYKLHAGGWASEPYTVTVNATNRDEAIQQVRRQYEDSRINPATFRARLAPDHDSA